jgi:hypothetical protein
MRQKYFLSAFQIAKKFTSQKRTLFSWIRESFVSRGSIPSTLELGMSCPLFRYENCITFWRSPYLSWFSWDSNLQFTEYIPNQLNWGNPCISWKNTIFERSRRVLLMFSQWELIYPVIGTLTICQHFQVGKIFPLWKIALFMYIEETCVSIGRIPCMLEAEVSCSLFCY